MILKAVLWLTTLLGLLPVALIATAFYYITTNLHAQELSDAAGQPVSLSDKALRERLFLSRSTFYMHRMGVGETSTPVHFRFWAIVVGSIGAVCLLIFMIFTFHVPTQ